jgi:hypothetical protein
MTLNALVGNHGLGGWGWWCGGPRLELELGAFDSAMQLGGLESGGDLGLQAPEGLAVTMDFVVKSGHVVRGFEAVLAQA